MSSSQEGVKSLSSPYYILVYLFIELMFLPPANCYCLLFSKDTYDITSNSNDGYIHYTAIRLMLSVLTGSLLKNRTFFFLFSPSRFALNVPVIPLCYENIKESYFPQIGALRFCFIFIFPSVVFYSLLLGHTLYRMLLK